MCYKKATNWNGWLRKSRDGIVAGFCEDHKPAEPPKLYFNFSNLRGIYDKEMGFTTKKLK
jgi:hypothetical protein